MLCDYIVWLWAVALEIDVSNICVSDHVSCCLEWFCIALALQQTSHTLILRCSRLHNITEMLWMGFEKLAK